MAIRERSLDTETRHGPQMRWRNHMCAGKTTNAPVKPHVRCRAHVTFSAHTLFSTAHSVITAFSKDSAELGTRDLLFTTRS